MNNYFTDLTKNSNRFKFLRKAVTSAISSLSLSSGTTLQFKFSDLSSPPPAGRLPLLCTDPKDSRLAHSFEHCVTITFVCNVLYKSHVLHYYMYIYYY